MRGAVPLTNAGVGGAKTTVSGWAETHVVSDHVAASHAVLVAIVEVVGCALVDVLAHVTVLLELVSLRASALVSTVGVHATEAARVQSQVVLALVKIWRGDWRS